MEEVIKEGTWKCPNCGARNRGRDVKCPGCGQAREGVEFEYDEAAEAVADEASLRIATGGADWVCGYCGTSNRAGAAKCRQCAAEAGAGKVRDVTDVPDVPPLPPRGSGWRPRNPALLGHALPSPARQSQSSAWPPGPALGWGLKLAGALVLAVLLWAFLSTRRSTHELTVQSASWSRSIEIERQLPVTESGWQLPLVARELSRRSEIHHYNKVLLGTRQVRQTYTEKVQTGTRKKKTGTKNMGNGYFKEIWTDVPVYENRDRERWVTEPYYRDDPVWAPKITYEAMRWGTVRTEKATGNDTAPHWPELRVAVGEREGKRFEVYSLELKDPSRGKVYAFTPDGATFGALTVGGVARAEFDGFGKLLKVGAVEKGR